MWQKKRTDKQREMRFDVTWSMLINEANNQKVWGFCCKPAW
jgi:hypothetical protein